MKLCSPLVLVLCLLGAAMSAAAQDYPEISAADRARLLDPPRQRPIPMVLDTDTYNEIDDQFAVVYALLSPELDVQALYAAPFQNGRSSGPADGMQKSYEELKRVLARLGHDAEGFAFKGSTRYLDPSKPEPSDATADLITRARQHSPENPLYVVAVGAISNVANAIRLEPAIIKNIVVVWCGTNSYHWPDALEFNAGQDVPATRTIFDSGVPFVQLPARPVVTHALTTVSEMERYVGGRGPIGDYLLEIFKDYSKDDVAWSKVLWDMTAVAWLVNPDWIPSKLEASAVITDNRTYAFDDSRHLIRSAYFVHRDPMFRDFFNKLDAHAKQ